MVARLTAPLVFVFVAATFVAGLRLDATGHVLGTPRPPLAFDLDPRAKALWLVVAVVLVACAVLVAPRLRPLRPVPFSVALFVLALVVRLAVGALRFGPEGWDEPWHESFNAKNEYVPVLPSIDHLGVRFFLDHFDDLLPALPVHAAGHPPGLVLALHALGISSPGPAAGLVIVAGTLAVPATYLLARTLLGDERRAQSAGLLGALACSSTLMGVVSADILYAALGAVAAVLLVQAGRRLPVAGAAALALASFFSYAIVALGAWAAIVRLLRDGWRTALGVAIACGVALVAFYVALYAATGFDLHAVVRATDEVYRESVARLRPYAFWLFGSPAAFLAFLGLPITWYAARALGVGQPVAVALAVVIVVSSVGGFTKAETERIWLMFVPPACVAAAAVLPERRLVPVLGLLAVQSVLVESLFGTVW